MDEIIKINEHLFSIQFNLKLPFLAMWHGFGFNTRHWHECISEKDSSPNHDPLVKLNVDIINSTTSLKEGIVNL